MEAANPLMIPVVLQNLFEQPSLELADLKRIRLVTKEWYFQSIPRWRKTAVITVSAEEHLWGPDGPDKPCSDSDVEEDDDDIPSWEDYFKVDATVYRHDDGIFPTVADYLMFLTDDTNTPTTNDGKSLMLEKKLNAYPFLRLKLINWNEVDQITDDFWTRIAGEKLEYLHLKNCQIVNSPPFPNSKQGVINITVNKLPNLTQLVISAPAAFQIRYSLAGSIWREDNPQGAAMIPHQKLNAFHASGCMVHWNLVFMSFPNLEDIRDSDEEYYMSFLERSIFWFLHVDPEGIDKLKSLDLIHSKESLITRNLSGWFGILNFANLTYLSISLECSVRECEAQAGLKLFFDNNPHLKVLKVLRTAPAVLLPLPFQEFPDGIEMPALKELHLYGNVTGSMQFLRFTPNLERLVIYYTCEGSQRVDGRRLGSGVRFTGDLVANAIRGCGDGPIKPLEKMRDLWVDVEFPVRSLGVVKRWMPNLRGLRTVLNHLSFKKVCAEWGEGLEELVCLAGSTVDERALVGVKPNVTDLIDLRRLGFEEKAIDISDGVVHEGFLEMKRLEEVRLPVEPTSQWSSEAIELLKQKINRVEIYE